jgi:alkyl sulfatase BDS1-like metallo-beta-lactamase superfamily hydrolase
MILIASSFAILPIQLLNGLLSIGPPTTSQPIEQVYGEEEQGSQEEVYLKFVSSVAQQQLSNISNGNVTNTTTTTVPQNAKGSVIPSEKGYSVQEIGNRLYSVSDGSYNVMFMVTDQGVVAIDAPPTLGEKCLGAIANVPDKPVSLVIYSHAHLDHIGAAGMLPQNAI